MKTRKLLALLVAIVMIAALFAGCKPDNAGSSVTPGTNSGSPDPGTEDLTGHKDPKFYTYYDSRPSFAVDWNPHTWETNEEGDLLAYQSSGLYELKLNDNLSAELFALAAAADPVDITASLTAEQKEKYGVPADAEEGYAYQYPLRDTVTFADGTVINAQSYADSLKLLLDPARKNGRVSSNITGEAPIAGAASYYYQGKISYVPAGADSDLSGGVWFSVSAPNGWWGDPLNTVNPAGYGDAYFTNDAGENIIDKWDAFAQDNGGYDSDGYFQIPEESIAEIGADFAVPCGLLGGGYEGEWKEFLYIAGDDFTDPKYADFDNVGIIVDDEYTMTLIYGTYVSMFNAKYYQSSTWIVHPELYESCSKLEGELLTSSYMTNVDSSISYGPYILSSFEADKEILLVRNENWFGYDLPELNGCYQPDAVRFTQMDQPTSVLSFQKGELDGAVMTAADLVDFGTSDYLLVTANTYLYRFFFNLNLDNLKSFDADDTSNSNTVALTNQNFRLAMSAAIDRNEYTKIANTTPAFTILNDLYTYDYEGEIADGARYRYRDLDVAKEAILDIYGIEWGDGTEYSSLDMAVDSVTGYDPEYAKSLMKTAFEELSATADETGFDPSKPVVIRVGYSNAAITPSGLALQGELNAKFAAAIEGSGFAGFEIEYITDEHRYNAIRDGRLACAIGAVGGARQDPFGMTSTFLDPDDSLFLGRSIPVTVDTLEITAKFDGSTETSQTKSLYEWYKLLDSDYVNAEVELKATIFAALESFYLKQGYTVPVMSGIDSELRSIRIEFPLEEPDPTLAFGGLQHVRFTMDDAEWAEYVSANIVDGALPYK